LAWKSKQREKHLKSLYLVMGFCRNRAKFSLKLLKSPLPSLKSLFFMGTL